MIFNMIKNINYWSAENMDKINFKVKYILFIMGVIFYYFFKFETLGVLFFALCILKNFIDSDNKKNFLISSFLFVLVILIIYFILMSI